jgi:uncharacterized protein (TIGR03382 family)
MDRDVREVSSMFKSGRSSLLVVTLVSACVTESEVVESQQEIVGGVATQITSVPWQVSMQAANGAHFCGGSIVAPTWILTASHCVADGAPARIVAGISRISQSASGQIRQVKRVIVYPGYTDPTVGKDATLIELAAPLTLDGTAVKAIRPVTPASPAALTAPGVMTTVSGWGTTVEGAQTLPDQLQSVQLPIVAMTTANAAYNTTLSADQLAAGVAAGGKDSCQGDSGGPLVVMDGSEPVLAGIVSWGEGCARANIPGMYARVSSFTTWADGYVGGPPVASAGVDVGVAPGQRATVDGSMSKDTGFGAIVSYEWKQVSGTPVTLEGATTKTASFIAPNTNGMIELELTVKDGGGATASDRVMVLVSPSGAPPNNPDGNGNGNDGDADGADVTGGCSTSGSPGLLCLLGLLFVRRRRR